MAAKKIHIKGLVQGVGFRPYIYRLAIKHGIKGWVENSNEGVNVHAEGDSASISAFISDIHSEKPPASSISFFQETEVAATGYPSFEIQKSADHSDAVTEVSPDIAVCEDCLADMKKQAHRLDYPFINCTNCGPRFTIIRDLPYDRPKTTMAPFAMCERCSGEYADILDRRFHAQPVACSLCGPSYRLHTPTGSLEKFDEILWALSRMFDGGKIIAMKGLGGFHLACDAHNAEAVDKLRELKHRDGKPFAVMFRDIDAARKYAFVDDTEKECLTGWQRPIVLLRSKKLLAPGVSMGFATVGGMLPYLPFHYLLFEKIRQDVIMLTSGNFSDEPILIDNEEALEQFGGLADAVLTNNRDIHNRADDSILRVIGNKPRLVRRSRSWVPRPVNMSLNVDGIFACGSELVNCFCLGKDHQAILSQHIGDLKNAETLEFFTESAQRFKMLFRAKPELLVHDLHPDYLSSRYALESGLPTLAVQHHHAHIAACMAEYGLDEKVIGISFDGVGLGTDGHIWGGEFMLCDLRGFERIHFFDYVAMPGGDLATREPWRMGLSYLLKAYGELPGPALPFLSDIPEEKLKLVMQAIRMQLNSPLCSSAGRLFDAAAALTGLCSTASFHAEAPMRLEAAVDPEEKGAYPFSFGNSIDTSMIIKGIYNDMQAGVPVSAIAGRFHNSVINIIFACVEAMAKTRGIRKVVLTGGTFQNKYILEKAEYGLKDKGYEVYSPLETPPNDGGIALGQLAIAAARRRKGSGT